MTRTTSDKLGYTKGISCLLFVCMAICLAGCGNSCPPASTTAPVSRLNATGSSTGLQKSTVAPPYNLEYVNGVVNPFQSGPTAVNLADNITASGWAVSGDTSAGGVDLLIDGTPLKANYGSERKDVSDHDHNPAHEKSGFSFSVPASQVGTGPHTIAVRIISSDLKSYFQSPMLTFQVR